MATYSIATLLGNEQWLSQITIFTVIFSAGFSLIHLIETRGAITGLLLAGSALTITSISEAVSVVTGAPFGYYNYTGQLGPKAFGLVPFIIPVAWLMVLYPAYETVRFLFKQLAPQAWRESGWRVGLIQCLLSAAAMTAWDLSLDPRMVSAGYWVWRDGGPYFGIPLSNFAGWLLTSFIIYAVWRVFDRPIPAVSLDQSQPATAPLHAALPVLAYIVTWLGESIANVLFWSGPVVGLAVFAGMGLFAVPALILLARQGFESGSKNQDDALGRAWRTVQTRLAGKPQPAAADSLREAAQARSDRADAVRG
ncbi:MAG: carotenoid biosynthesis protein [Anaerolineae bacterium]